MRPTREDAWRLLNEYTQSASLIGHALAVEAAMRYYARQYGADEEFWAVTGLIHDFDYEQHPTLDEHPMAGVAILEGLGWPEEIIQAVKGHSRELDVPRDTPMAKTLFAVDELTGLIVACALVRPDKNIHHLEVKSVRKKWNSKSFARGVNRQDIELGASELGVDLDEHIGLVIEAMSSISRELGLDGAGS
ncbi:MAG: HDIG domain-containing protein [Anaerolineae bacterium]|nr:HDIG domain-containing protein [Anaerolineae bacterium]